MVTMSVSRLRADLRDALERVKRGEEVALTQHGQLIARIVPIMPMTAREAARQASAERAAALLQSIDELRGKPLRLSGAITPELAEQWVRELRAERDEE